MPRHSQNILLFAELSGRMLDCFLEPLVEENEVSVDVVRFKMGLPRRKVRFIVPPFYSKYLKSVLYLWKILKAIQLAIKNDFCLICSIHSIPHTVFARLVSILARRPLVYVGIGGIFEFKRYNVALRLLAECVAVHTNFSIVFGDELLRYLKALGMEEERMLKMSNIDLVNLDQFHPISMPITYELVVVSRLESDKNIDVFLRIVAKLKEKLPHIRAAVVGRGRLKDNLIQLSRRLDIDSNVEFLGFIKSPERLNRILNSSLIFVSNSCHETGPFTIMEAMSAGVCCISSMVGEVPDIINNGENGIIMDRFDDISGYSEKIHYLLKNPFHIYRMGRNATDIKFMQNSNRPKEIWRIILESILCYSNSITNE